MVDAVRVCAVDLDGYGPRIQELLVRAFQDDPGFRWIVGPEPGHYARYMGWLASLAVHVVRLQGVALAAMEGEVLLGAALLLPPAGQLEGADLRSLTSESGPVGRPPFHRSFRSADAPEALRCDPRWGKAASRRDRAFARCAGEAHKQIAPMPHWYLWFLAVDPEAQGRKVGSKLLAEIQAMQDRDGVPCYLERCANQFQETK
ncbi:unnamed protein product [Effrenium voratum]|nr:unnamed protein product [Effrenium voratum]